MLVIMVKAQRILSDHQNLYRTMMEDLLALALIHTSSETKIKTLFIPKLDNMEWFPFFQSQEKEMLNHKQRSSFLYEHHMKEHKI